MINLIPLLLIQVGCLFFLPLFRRIFIGSSLPIRSKKIIYIVLLLILNIGISFGIFGSFITSFYTENIAEISSSIVIMQRTFYQLELGLNFSLIPITVYVLFLLALVISAISLSFDSDKWTVGHLDRLSIFSAMVILFLFSPNFFQMLIIMIVIDIIILEFLYYSLISSNSPDLKGFKQMLLSVIIGNILVISSITMLIRRGRSFDYSSILIDIQYKFFLFTPYFTIICILFLLGLTAKSSLFPFHVWKRKTFTKDDFSFFFVQLLYLLLPVLLVFITPYLDILHVIQNVFAWYGILIAFLAVIGIVFLNKKSEISSYLLASSFGFLLFFIGIDYHLVAFHQFLLIPFVFICLAIFMFRENIENLSLKRKNYVKIFIWSISIVIPLLIVFGIPPLSSTITALTYSISAQNLIARYGLLIFGICTLVLTFSLVIRIMKKSWIECKQIHFTLSDTIVLSTAIIILASLSLLFPYFLIFEPMPSISFVNQSLYLYSALPIGVACLIILISYLAVPKYLKQTHNSIVEATTTVSPVIRKIANFDFIFEFFSFVYLNGILPSAKWIKEKIIVLFFIGIILAYSYRFFKFILLKLKKFIFDILIPFLQKHFTRISKFIRSLERTTIRKQLQLAIAFLLILIILVVVLYNRGSLQ